MVIRIAGTVGESIVDGPGIRYTIFTQGCPHHCEGCHAIECTGVHDMMRHQWASSSTPGV